MSEPLLKEETGRSIETSVKAIEEYIEGGGGGGGSSVIPSTSTVAGAQTAASMKINGTNWNMPAGGGGEPAAYLKNATYSANKLTITKKDDTTVEVDIDEVTPKTSQTSGATDLQGIEVNGTTYNIPQASVDNSSIGRNSSQQLEVKDSGVSSSKLANNAVSTVKIVDNAVTTAKISTGAVTTERLNADAVTNAKLADNAVQAENIKDGEVTHAKLATDAVEAGNIKNGEVGTDELAIKAVKTAKIDDNAVGSVQLANGAVSSVKLANKAVETAKINDEAVGTGQLSDLAVTTAKIAADAIDNTRLADNAVQAENIKDGEVTATKLASNSVLTNAISNGAVTKAKVDGEFFDSLTLTGTTVADDIQLDNDLSVTGTSTLNNVAISGTATVQTPTANAHATNKQYVDDSIAAVSGGAFVFKGYMCSSAPTSAYDLREGTLWYQGTTMPTVFPIAVYRYTSGAWSTTTENYTPNPFDTWSDINATSTEIYYFNGAWKSLDPTAVKVDNLTIGKNASNQLEIKDGGVPTVKLADGAITKAKIDAAANVVYTTDTQTLTNKTIDVDNNTLSNVEVDNFKTGVVSTAIPAASPADTKLPTEKAVKDALDAKVNITDIQNVLTDTSTNKPLAANQGKVLNEHIGDLSTLTTTAKTSAVAAINELETAKLNVSDIVDNLTEHASDKPLSSMQGYTLNTLKVAYTDIADNLTTSASNKVLSAQQGKILNEKFTKIWKQADEPADAAIGDLWVDTTDVASDYLPLAGGTMSGDIVIGDNAIKLGSGNRKLEANGSYLQYDGKTVPKIVSSYINATTDANGNLNISGARPAGTSMPVAFLQSGMPSETVRYCFMNGGYYMTFGNSGSSWAPWASATITGTIFWLVL